MQPPEYAIAGSYLEFQQWRRADPKKRGKVIYLHSAERVESMLAQGVPKGVLHRIGAWETSPARTIAEQLEA